MPMTGMVHDTGLRGSCTFTCTSTCLLRAPEWRRFRLCSRHMDGVRSAAGGEEANGRVFTRLAPRATVHTLNTCTGHCALGSGKGLHDVWVCLSTVSSEALRVACQLSPTPSRLGSRVWGSNSALTRDSERRVRLRCSRVCRSRSSMRDPRHDARLVVVRR